jgi:PAS domain S-box-containing protein
MFVVAPVIDEEDEIIAALGFRLNPATGFTRILQLGRTRKTGETYAFNASGTLLSESRFDRNLREVGLISKGKKGILAIAIRDPGGDLVQGFQPDLPRNEQPFTAMAKIAISGRSGINIEGYRNYHGARVVGVWTWDPSMQWTLVTEIGADEAYRSFNFTRILILIAIGGTGFLAIGITLIVNVGRTRALSLVSAVDVGRTRALQFAKIAQEREARIRGVVDNVGDAIITIDEKGTIESFSPAAEKIFGYFSPEVVGRNIKILMPEPHRSAHDTYIKNYLETGESKIIGIGREAEGVKKDGTVFPLDIAINEVWLEDHRIFIGTLRDITQRKQAEDELKRSHNELQTAHQELKASLVKVQEAHNSLVASEKLAGIGGLTAGVCRQVLYKINTISTQLQKLKMKNDDSDLLLSLRASREETERIEKIIRSLLKFSREDEGKIISVRIHEELDSILTLVDHHMQLNGIKIVREFDLELPELKVNPDEIGQVFFYIIDNARHAMPEGGTLTASTGQIKKNGANYIRINIADTGIGIKKEDLKKIFDAFFSSKPQGQGTGMGLPVCSHLIQKHGGTISVESERGKGTTFSIDLPLQNDQKQ